MKISTEEIVRLYRARESLRTIASAAGISHEAVRKILIDAGEAMRAGGRRVDFSPVESAMLKKLETGPVEIRSDDARARQYARICNELQKRELVEIKIGRGTFVASITAKGRAAL